MRTRSTTLGHFKNELPMVWWALRRPKGERRDQLKSELRIMRSKLAEGVVMDIAWALPGKVAYWAAIRIGANATTGQYGNTSPCDLLFMDALKRAEGVFI